MRSALGRRLPLLGGLGARERHAELVAELDQMRALAADPHVVIGRLVTVDIEHLARPRTRSARHGLAGRTPTTTAGLTRAVGPDEPRDDDTTGTRERADVLGAIDLDEDLAARADGQHAEHVIDFSDRRRITGEEHMTCVCDGEFSGICEVAHVFSIGMPNLS